MRLEEHNWRRTIARCKLPVNKLPNFPRVQVRNIRTRWYTINIDSYLWAGSDCHVIHKRTNRRVRHALHIRQNVINAKAPKLTWDFFVARFVIRSAAKGVVVQCCLNDNVVDQPHGCFIVTLRIEINVQAPIHQVFTRNRAVKFQHVNVLRFDRVSLVFCGIVSSVVPFDPTIPATLLITTRQDCTDRRFIIPIDTDQISQIFRSQGEVLDEVSFLRRGCTGCRVTVHRVRRFELNNDFRGHLWYELTIDVFPLKLIPLSKNRAF